MKRIKEKLTFQNKLFKRFVFFLSLLSVISTNKRDVNFDSQAPSLSVESSLQIDFSIKSRKEAANKFVGTKLKTKKNSAEDIKSLFTMPKSGSKT